MTQFFAWFGATMLGALTGILLAELVLHVKDRIQGLTTK